MCGIVGYCGNFPPSSLEKANLAQHHRGPDDKGYFVDGIDQVGLAQTRLSILDLSALGHQPMLNEEGFVILVYNGELYNFQELKSQLESKGCVFKSHSDTEVVLNAYLIYGEEMLSMLNGMFAFAIWDKTKKSLFVARDALGIKPLYYFAHNHQFAFASEMKALLHFLPQTKNLDLIALQNYMTFLWCPGERTPFQEIKKLEPGYALRISNGQIIKKWQWYTLPVFRDSSQKLNYQESLTGLVDHLREAVHRQLIADVPVGAFLSGGLDSSSIVAFAREKKPDIRCFSIKIEEDQEEGFVEDLPYAQKVAQHLGVGLDVVSVNSKQMAMDLPEMVAQLDEPLADPAPLNVLYISRLARKNGIKVLLSGAGGDDFLTGYRRHQVLKYHQLISFLPSTCLRLLKKLGEHINQSGAMGRRLLKVLSRADLTGDDLIVDYFSWFSQNQISNLFSRHTKNITENFHPSYTMRQWMNNLPIGLNPLQRMLALEQRYFLADHNLLYTDKMSMAASIEVRVPFLDMDFVEFAEKIPVKFKQNGQQGKWIFKKAMEPYLPHDVIYRPKSGFGAPLRKWIQKDLKEVLLDTLSQKSIEHRGIYDFTKVNELIRDNEEGRVDASYLLLSLMNIELWCRKYMDN